MKTLQIDIYGPTDGYTKGTLIYDGRMVEILIPTPEYQRLIEDGLFIRKGDTKDSAGVLNTTMRFVADKERPL